MVYRWLSTMEIFHPFRHIVNLRCGFSELPHQRIGQAYQRKTFRNFPIARSQKVSQIPVFFPRKNQPYHVPGQIFNKSFKFDDVWVGELKQELRFSERQLGENEHFEGAALQ